MEITYRITANTAQFNQSVRESVDELNELRKSGNMTAEQLDEELQKLGRAAAAGGLQNTEEAVGEFNQILQASGLSAAEAATAVNAFQHEAVAVVDSTGEAGEKLGWFQKQLNGIREASYGMADLSSLIELLPAPLNDIVRKGAGVLNTFKLIAKTPLLFILQSITWLFEQMQGFMSSTTSAGAEGFADLQSKAQSVNKVLAKFEAVLAVIANLGYKVASALYDAFSNPEEALNNLVATIKNSVLKYIRATGDAFGALGGIIKSALTLDTDGIERSWGQLKTAVADAFDATLVGAFVDEIKAAADEAGDLAAQIEEIKNREDALRIARAKWTAKEAQLDVGIRSAQEEIAEETDVKKRLAAIDKAQGLINQKYAQRIKFAKEELAIKELSNNPTASSLEDLEEVERLRAELINLEAEQKAEGLRFAKQKTALMKQQAAQELKAQKALADMLREQQERQLELEEDSLEKSIKLIEARKDAELEALKERRKAWEEEHGAMDEATAAAFESEAALIEKTADADVAKLLTTEYETFAHKLGTLSRKFDSNIATLQARGLEGEAAVAQNQKVQEIGAAASDWIEQGLAGEGTLRALQEFEQQLGEMTGEALIAKVAEVEEALTSMEGLNPDQVALLYAQLTKLKAKAREAKKEINKGMTEEAIKQLEEFADNAEEVGNAIGDLGDTFGGTFKDAAKVIQQCAQLAKTIITTITTITTEASRLMAMASKQAAEEIKSVERASVILAIIGAVLQAAQAIASMFKNDDELLKEIQQNVEDYQAALRKLRNEKELLNDVSTIWGDDAFAGFINSVNDATAFLAKFRKDVEAAGNISAFGDSHLGFGREYGIGLYKNLGKSADSALTSVQQLAKGIEQTQIMTQKGKLFKKTKYSSLANLGVDLVGKDDVETMDKIKEFANSGNFSKISKDQQNAINLMIEDWDAYQEALQQTTESLTSWFGGIADAWGDAITDAFENGTNAAENFGQNVGKILADFGKQLAQSIFVTDILEQTQKEVKDMIASDDYQTMSAEEQAKAVANVAAKTADLLKEQTEAGAQFLQNWNDDLAAKGYSAGSATDANTLSGAIAGASQESIDLLSGYCNAVRIQQVESLDVMRQQLVSLTGVENNTAAIASTARRILDRLEGQVGDDATLRASGL